MKVRELIDALKVMPAGAEVLHLWDGKARTAIEHVWIARDGNVITADNGMVCYLTETRPAEAPTSEEDMYWETPELSGVISIQSDLRLQPFGGMREPTLFITEYLRLGEDGRPELIRLPLSEWPEWADPLRRILGGG